MTISRTALAAALSILLCSGPTLAQNFPVTPAQRQSAAAAAQQGLAADELAANAPERYSVKQGDTLWAISTLYLKSPWRWPQLWGMNLQDIQNPHRIYPGQVLVLVRSKNQVTLQLESSAVGVNPDAELPTVKLSPRARSESLADQSLPTLNPSAIEPFLAEPVVVSEDGLRAAARIVAGPESRVLLMRGDRAYARGAEGSPLLDDEPRHKQYRVFRDVTALKDPATSEILGYEAQYVGKALLMRGESNTAVDADGKTSMVAVPATIDIVASKEEMRVGDRLLPEPARQLRTYTPHAPATAQQGRIVSVYGSAVANAAQNQVVAINLGSHDGVDPGTVFAILEDGRLVQDSTDSAKTLLKLPDERNGLLMVFRCFDRVSYALILEITNVVRVGDRLTSPR